MDGRREDRKTKNNSLQMVVISYYISSQRMKIHRAVMTTKISVYIV